MGNAGGSADEHAKRLIEEAGAWAAGAEGERRVAAALEGLPDAWTVVHDRLLRPGRSQANLDHIAVGPSGVYLIDAKNRAGVVTEHEGGLFQHRTRNGARESLSLAAELAKVHGMAAYMAVEADTPVVPVLCLAEARAVDFGEPRMLRGVWVVPVGALLEWLAARDATVAPGKVASLATRVITEFPSTSTDGALLAAMGSAKPGSGRRSFAKVSPRAQRSSRAPRPVKPSGPRFASVLGRLVLLGVGGALIVSVLGRLPDLSDSWLRAVPEDSQVAPTAAPPTAGGVAGSQSPGARTSPPAKATAAKATTARTPAASRTSAKPVPLRAVPLGPPDCSDATGAEVASIIHRTVYPIVTQQGCAWGTRLDDLSTQLVSIVMKDEHSPYEVELVTSVKQKRVVFGNAYDTDYRPATRASVASGEWIVRGARPVRARADTVVVVATTKLGISDDKGRRLAVALAAAANS